MPAAAKNPPPLSKTLKSPTPNPCVCLLTRPLNIYMLIQTVSGGKKKPHCPPLDRIRPGGWPRPPREGETSRAINLTKPNSKCSVHRGEGSKQQLGELDRALISTTAVRPSRRFCVLASNPRPQTKARRTNTPRLMFPHAEARLS